MGQVHIRKLSGQREGHGSNEDRKSLFLQCKPSISNNSSSIKRSTIKFACSIGFVAMAD